MDKKYNFHFTPPRGWMNDPNGTIYIDGTYHLFYQHYPNDCVWGPMHWGHAHSIDGIHWEDNEIALFPDELGYIFSGSCILDTKNVSGLGSNECAPLLAFYTSHNPDTGEQQQSLAYSNDYYHFTKYKANPIITNTKSMGNKYKNDFRDPKVFANPILGGFSMVLSAGPVAEFYHSYNLLVWEKTGEFNPFAAGVFGIVECPDCVLLDEKWILLMSTIVGDDRRIPYFIGEFDGKTFNASTSTNDNIFTDITRQNAYIRNHIPCALIDYGPDNYATVTFANTNPPVLIGWGENWNYINSMPANSYRGKMSLPRTLQIIDTPHGPLLSFDVFNKDKIISDATLSSDNEEIINTASFIRKKITNGNTFAINDDLFISVEKTYIKVTRNPKLLPASIDDSFHTMTAPRVYKNETDCSLSIYEDCGFYEIFADNGTIVFSITT